MIDVLSRPGLIGQSAGRGVLYLVWGPNCEALLRRSTESLRAYHPELPVHVERLPENATLLDKAEMLRHSPFEQTLFLDIDTLVLGRLDFGFDRAERHGLACSICECPWARRYQGIGQGDLIEYNTGVIFFARRSKPIFDSWARLAKTLDSSASFRDGRETKRCELNDQASFALAIDENQASPFVLPLNWNFRPVWHNAAYGPIKIWHERTDPPHGFTAWNRSQSESSAVLQLARYHGTAAPPPPLHV